MSKKMNDKPAPREGSDVAEFDQEFVIDTFKPLSEEDKARWERVKNKSPGSKRNLNED